MAAQSAEQAGSRTLILHGWLRGVSEINTGLFRSPRLGDFDGSVDGPQGTRWRVVLRGWGFGDALQRYHALITCEWPLSAAVAAPGDLSMDVDVRLVIAEQAFALAWRTAESEGEPALLEGCTGSTLNAVIAAPVGGTQRVELKRPPVGAAATADAAPPCAYIGRHVPHKDVRPVTVTYPPGAIVADTIAMQPLLGGEKAAVDLPVFVYITVKRVRYGPVERCRPTHDDAAWPASSSPLAGGLRSSSGGSGSGSSSSLAPVYKHRTWTSHTSDAREKVGIVGISNQGATCYLNSLLQTLFHTRLMRKLIYEAPVEWTPTPPAPAAAAAAAGGSSAAITIDDDDDGDKPSAASASPLVVKPPQWSDYEWAKAKPAASTAAAAGAASSGSGTGSKQASAAAAPTDPGVVSDRTRVVAALQSQFLDMEAGLSKTATTTALTKSFGWTSSDAFVQHDVQELSKVCVPRERWGASILWLQAAPPRAVHACKVRSLP